MRLAIIPARGGSKRIPRKNVREFCGRPIIAYSIDAAKASGCFDEVMVSTDDTEIASVAMDLGAQVPFKRSPENSGDHATTASVVLEVLGAYASRGVDVTHACCIYPTAPFVTPASIASAFDLLDRDACLDGVVPVARFSYPIQRALRMVGGRVQFMQPEHLLTRSQDLEPAYHDAGQFYLVKVRAFLEEPSLFSARTGSILLPSSVVQDIDTLEDWEAAELKFRLLQAVAPGRVGED